MARRSLLVLLGAAAALLLAWFGWRGGASQRGTAAMPPGPARVDEESWRALLQDLADLAIADPQIRPRLTPEQVERRWLGEPPAGEEQIAAAERRLGLRLPPSYRAFLRVTNGWHHPSSFVGMIHPVERIAPFLAENRDWAMAYVNPAVPAWLRLIQGGSPPLP
ncbi:MAG TPA: SMI1/KNR4 family protein, partial [Acetobacteraceae bacterium]|nr:SMI1/KNR4 family protein [Acetobacteraceae bacterium]